MADDFGTHVSLLSQRKSTVTRGTSPYITAILFSHWCRMALRYRLQPKVPYCVELDIYPPENPCWYRGTYFLHNLFYNLNLSVFWGGVYSKSKHILLYSVSTLCYCHDPALILWHIQVSHLALLFMLNIAP